MSKVSAREFKDWISETADAFRRKIELEVEAFPTDRASQQARLTAVSDPVTGYKAFCELYFPHYRTRPDSALHEALFIRLPQVVADPKGCRELVEAPRGSAKSSHIALMFVIWCITLERKHYICLIMDAFEQAAVSLEAVKAELEVNPRLVQDFPNLMGQGRVWREGDIVTANNIKVESFGTGKKIRGRRHGPYRPDLVVLDDIENDENVASPAQRDKLENWIEKAVLKLGPTDGTMDVIYAGTVLHFDAVIERFAKKPAWRVTRFRAIMGWPDRMDLWDTWEETYLNDGEMAADAFYQENRSDMDAGAVLNWPANHTLEFLMKERAGSHGSFESEYQNNPIARDNPFGALTWWVMRRADVLHFGAIDPSLGKRGGRGDPSAILVGAIDREAQHLDVLRASIRRRTPDVIIEDAIALQREFSCQLWFVEAVQFQELLRTELMKRAAKAGLPMPCYPVTPITDKNLRIERLQIPVSDGMVRLHSSQTTLIQQLQQWPNADHDDGPDCLEMLWTHGVRFGAGAFGGMQIAPVQPGAAGFDQDMMDGYRL